MERIISHQRRDSPAARHWLAAAVVANLGLLAIFKYAGILAGLPPDGWIPADAERWLRSIPLPIGISFYTFQAVSLLIDVHRRHVSEETRARLDPRSAGPASSFGQLALYIGFFPQLVAGPIVKAGSFIDQIGGKLWRDIPWPLVLRYLIGGYFLKIFVADNLAEQTAMLTIGTGALAHSGPVALMAMLYAYGFQIFADFAGYSLIAIGLGLMFGYRLPENFDFPYLSRSITEFWRRWHLSLSAWLRDYLYIPLGGNRNGAGRTYINLFLVMFLGGLWHGAEWKFALWGTLHGVFLAAERFLTRRRGKLSEVQTMEAPDRRKPTLSTVRSLAGWCYAFHAVTFLWLTFLMPDMAHVAAFFTGLASGVLSFPGQPLFALFVYGGAAVLYHAWGWLREHRPKAGAWFLRPSVEGAVHALMVFLIITNPGAPRGFIYFQF
jgi:alginate O-acetyltransferase complex protein AlgI